MTARIGFKSTNIDEKTNDVFSHKAIDLYSKLRPEQMVHRVNEVHE